MEQLEVDFRAGLTQKGWNNEQLIEIWQLMLKQAEYCFNRGHAVAYGLLSYLTAYLKTHYTIYFMAALLTAALTTITSSTLSAFASIHIRLPSADSI